ncbi:MAG: hypothetical protein ABIH38_02880 [Patescibacteria group bacterium]
MKGKIIVISQAKFKALGCPHCGAKQGCFYPDKVHDNVVKKCCCGVCLKEFFVCLNEALSKVILPGRKRPVSIQPHPLARQA